MNTKFLLATSSIAALALAATPAIAGDVTGTVVDETDTVALQSATIEIEALGRQVVTARDGTYRIADLPAGTYEITARYVGAPAETMTVEVPATGTVVVNFALGGDDASRILVIGQGANISSALSRKYASDTVSDVLTRDAIGQFPDQNVAESLRRLPGINVLNDHGEGRFVSVRGLDPNLNASSINGVRVPAPESDIRAVALDVISSDIIESIEVKKSLTPDMDADTIGASIEINTVSAFDRRGNYVTARAEGSYNNYSEQLGPKASLDFAYRLADNIGVSGGVSYYQREYEVDTIEADGWDDDDGFIFPEEVQYRDYDVERERLSATLGFDFRASESTDLYIRGLFSQFDDQEYRRRTTLVLEDGFITGSGFTGSFADFDADEPGEEYELVVERDIKDRFERQRTYSLALGGETVTGPWTIEYMASYAKSSEKEDGNVDPTQFEREFSGDGLVLDLDFSDPRTPLYAASGVADFFDAATYELNDIEFVDTSDAQDEEFAARLDVAREFAMGNGVFTVQTGAKGRWREKTYNADVEFYEYDGEGTYSLADVLGEQTFRRGDIGPVASYTGATDFFLNNFADFELQGVDTIFDSAVSDYAIEEDILAAYLLGRWDSDNLSVIGGVRYEHTQTDIFGNNVLLVEEDGTLPNGETATEDTVIISDSFQPKNYGFWLPSLNIRFEPQDDLVMRLAGYRSVVRPPFSKVAPRFATEINDDDEIEGEFGNPSLKPYEAWNFDASLEYYFSGNGAVTAAFFYKDISNYVVDVEYNAEDLNENDQIDPEERLVFNGIAFDEAVIPLNGDSAEVWGIELGFAQQWTMLPGALSGLLTQFNYTYTDATGTVPDAASGTLGAVTETRTIPLPTTSKHTFNAVLGYENGPLSLRLAGTYRDGFLDELGSSAEEDRLIDDHFQLDFSAKYRITDNVQIFYEWINITEEDFFAYNTYGVRQNVYESEFSSWTMKGGVRVNF
ncbi:TonB-dependent receptor [Alteraurantiacibacter aquimixticola]|uniref:TonB-dependent receptor n=1 Tax=Alteraurantiacibacter aquimixticola TaxID=2489173 RepID=A0A4T3F4Q1_9SPHN|nr:TonB-dependent receptor [Alteraurantiacibacter aquimixticola]TIX49683.1 TonB-dependent receptor [Alteraurantiacibacter aquimixticola]